MKKLKTARKFLFNLTKYSLSLLGLAIIYIFYQSYEFSDSSLISLNTPYGKVLINFDKHGVPHIQGNSDLSAFFALGYIHAKNRLWQMEFQRHVAKGSLSELLGKATIEQDKYLRTWGFYKAAKNDWHYFDAQTKSIIQSYTDGVNAYLQRHISPFELTLLFHKPEIWTVYDSYAWGKIIAWQQENIWQDKIINYLLLKKFSRRDVLKITKSYSTYPTTVSSDEFDLTKDSQEIDFPENEGLWGKSFLSKPIRQLHELIVRNTGFEQQLNIKKMPGKGSNAWVVSGKFTKSGQPILANDVHLELSSPGAWYLVDIKSPNMHVIGATLPGSPAVLIGRNDKIAWGITDAGTDTQDIYILPENEKLVSHKETIKIFGGKSQDYIAYESQFGPVISPLLDHKYFNQNIAVQWTALLPGDKTIQSFIKINYAHDWKSFENALKDFVAPSLNFFYIDKAGNIGYHLAGKIPIRYNYSGRYPIADTQNKQWKSYIPFSDLPHSFNPPKGFLVSANNQIVSDSYPYKLTYHWREMPYRALKITEVLENHQPIDINSTKKLQLDIESNLWRKFKNILLNVKPLNQASREAIEILKQWDGNMSKAKIAPTIFAFWFEQIKTLHPRLNTYLVQLPNPDFIFYELETNEKFCLIHNYKDCNDFLSQSLSKAISEVNLKLGADKKNWQWEKVHRAQFKGIIFGELPIIGGLWNKTIGTGGGAYTINMGAYNKDYQQIGAAMYRQIVDMSPENNSYFIMATGQSGDVLSEHYTDLLTIWSCGEYIHMWDTT